MFIHFRLAYLVERKNVKKCAQYLALDDFLCSVIGKQMTPALLFPISVSILDAISK